MPVCGSREFIRQAVCSVCTQTFPSWELLIIDDGSSYDVQAYLSGWLAGAEGLSEAVRKLRFFRNRKRRGAAYSRTRGMKLARGKYIAFLDSDDFWPPRKLEKQVGFMERTGEPFTCTAFCKTDRAGNPAPAVYLPPDRTDYHEALLLSCPMQNSSVMYNRQELGAYEVPDIRKRNDFALFLKILKDTPYCRGIPENLLYHRVHGHSLSKPRILLWWYHWQLYRRVERLSVRESLLYLWRWVWVKGMGHDRKIRYEIPSPGTIRPKKEKKRSGG